MENQKQTVDLGVTLYDMNKQAMRSEPPLDMIMFNRKMIEVSDRIIESKKEYWMLLNNERKDYTVFKINRFISRNIIEDISIALNNRGQILSIDKQKDGNFEIWVKDYNTGEAFAYYLFDYTFGMVII